MKLSCRACGSPKTESALEARERMFGLGGVFNYVRCPACEALQLLNPPASWERYYPAGYYSFGAMHLPMKGPRAVMAGWRDRLASKGSPLARFLGPVRCMPEHLASLAPLHLSTSTRILDVGAGSGTFLKVLYRAGWRHLAGIDPYLQQDHHVTSDVWVRRQPIEQATGEYDLITLHHVLEHLEDQVGTLEACRGLLADNGRILVRIPTVSSSAWETYGDCWAALDAPRHVVLHSRRSIGLLANRCGLSVDRLWDDSNAFQFWGSELYLQDKPLMLPEGGMLEPMLEFGPSKMAQFEEHARRLNAEGRGDQIVVVLSK
jgi:SAM-dependent methyltransferase